MVIEKEWDLKQRKYTRKIKYYKVIHFDVDIPGGNSWTLFPGSRANQWRISLFHRKNVAVKVQLRICIHDVAANALNAVWKKYETETKKKLWKMYKKI